VDQDRADMDYVEPPDEIVVERLDRGPRLVIESPSEARVLLLHARRELGGSSLV
jgi:hypothetical protein